MSPAEPALSPQRFRDLLIEALDDPATARHVARRLLLPSFPIRGAACAGPSARDITSGDFGANCSDAGNYNMAGGGKVGIGTNDPKTLLHAGTTNYASKTNGGVVRISKAVGAEDTVVNALHIDTETGNWDYRRGVAVALGHQSSTFNEYTSRIVHFGDENDTRASKLQLQTHSATDGVWNTGILIDHVGNVGIGTTTPLGALDAVGTAGAGAWGYFRGNANGTNPGGSFNLGLGISWNRSGGQGETNLVFGTSAGSAPRLEIGEWSGSAYTADLVVKQGGNVGIGTTSPQAKLHVKGGNVSIEDDRGAGRLGFAQSGENDARIVLYRGGNASVSPDITVLRNFPPSSPPQGEATVTWTLLRVWAPKIPSGTPDREATISLVRDLNSTDDDSQEFIDIYNNGYASETQYGIRIQKRTGSTTAQYRDFVFDQFDGTTYTPLMILKADTKVGIGTSDPQTLLDVAGQARVKPVTFANLPSASSSIQGAIAAVTDSTTNTWGATITGAGANKVLAYCNGTNWTVVGK